MRNVALSDLISWRAFMAGEQVAVPQETLDPSDGEPRNGELVRVYHVGRPERGVILGAGLGYVVLRAPGASDPDNRAPRAPIVCVDFDGTLATRAGAAYPAVGEDLGGVYWLTQLQRRGCVLILSTCRDGEALERVCAWLDEHCPGLFAAVNEQAPVSSIQSRKLYADVYVDDRALGAPIKTYPDGRRSPHFDWGRAGPALLKLMEETR